MRERGLLVVISAPSGGGKTTIIQKVLASGARRYQYSISATTRTKRLVERDGRDYRFMTLQEFEEKKSESEFVEWAEVHGNYYGTLRAPLEKWLADGETVLLDLDVDGGLAIKRQFGDDAVLIFIAPPSLDSLRSRLRERRTESEAQIEKRLERYPKEIKKAEEYDYRIVNENIDRTVEQVTAIIEKHGSRRIGD